jgi:hypothetical protein
MENNRDGGRAIVLPILDQTDMRNQGFGITTQGIIDRLH